MESHGGKISGRKWAPIWPFSVSSAPSYFCPEDRKRGLPRFQSNLLQWPPSRATRCYEGNQQQLVSSHHCKIIPNIETIPKTKFYNSQWTQRSWHWFSSSIFVPFRGKASQRRHIKFVKRISVEFSLTETAKNIKFNSRLDRG